MNALIQLAPTILGFLGGPAGGLAGAGLQWLAGKFGAKDSTVDAIKEALQGYKPEDAITLRKLDIEFQEFCMANEIKVDLAQIKVNEEEAKSTDKFTSRGRPAAVWVGVIGLAYSTFIEPFMRFVATVIFQYGGTFPPIDTSVTTAVLFGLLGLSGLRSFDKVKGVAAR